MPYVRWVSSSNGPGSPQQHRKSYHSLIQDIDVYCKYIFVEHTHATICNFIGTHIIAWIVQFYIWCLYLVLLLSSLRRSGHTDPSLNTNTVVLIVQCKDLSAFNHASTENMMYWDNYSIPQEICTRFCCALLCCGYAIVHYEFTWSIYPYSSGLLCWHWGNRLIATVPVK